MTAYSLLKFSIILIYIITNNIVQNIVFKIDFAGCSDGKTSAYNAGDLDSISGWGRSPRQGNVNPIQYSYVGNPMDGGAW